MKISSENFSKLDRKWIKITDKTSIMKIEYALAKKSSSDIYLAHVYIDHFLGLSCIIVGPAKEENGYFETYADIKKLEENICEFHADYLEIANLEAEIIDAKMVQKTLAYIIESYVNENWYLPFLEKQKYIFEARTDKALDEYREKYFPDVITFLIAKKGLESEIMYGRIEGLDEENNDIILTALNDSFEEKLNVKKGDLVAVNYIELEGYKGYVCVRVIPYALGIVKYGFVKDESVKLENLDYTSLIKYAKSVNKKLTDLSKEEIEKYIT
ncbi:MAG: hypothetical protein RSB87_06725 [Clostridia bacterium]